MKIAFFLLLLSIFSCKPRENHPLTDANPHPVLPDTIAKSQPPPPDTLVTTNGYSNEIFKDVMVTSTNENTILVRGKARVFEATFGWVVEDGHNELLKGHQMTDAGAPAWGNFSFTAKVPGKKPNSTLTLILFESSPKDGSRQHELPIVLYDK